MIGNGENERQLKTLAEDIAQKAKNNAGTNALGIEGFAAAGWVLIDFGDLVVHLFSPQKRDYYGLEDIWDDAHRRIWLNPWSGLNPKYRSTSTLEFLAPFRK